MTDFLNSLKADLLDRRLLPILALVAAGLVAAVAYVALGGGSTAATRIPAATPVHTSTGISVTPAPASPAQAVAETTSGSSAQARGRSHNPFNLLPADVKKAAPSSSTTTKGTSTSPSTPAKPKTVYHLSVLFGVVPTGVPASAAQLTPYASLKLLTALPSVGQPLIVFRGVIAGGKSALFTVVGEAILHGSATCLPSPTQCQNLELKPGQSEQLEYLPVSGPVLTYELRVVSIKSSKASSATVSRIVHSESASGRELLRRAGLVAIPGLRYSSVVGVLTFARHAASVARARVALQQRRSG
jgi:hypothetical protein